jgi:hypothetical protein
MTAVLTVTCDVCRKPVESDRHLIRVESGSLRGRRPEADFCPGCFSAFLGWLDQNQPEAPGPVQAPA